MIDDDLRLLLRSPALTLEPPETLAADVRRGARRQRLRARAGAGALAGALVAIGVLAGPDLAGSVDGLRNHPNQSAGVRPDPRAPAATTEVVTLQTINGAQVLTWFEGADWCTATTRITRQKTCLGAVDPQHRGFSWLVPSRSPSVTVDNEHVVAGIVPPGASRVGVHMSDGREFEGEIVVGSRFPVPVWSTRVDDSHGRVAYYVAYDLAGREIARKVS